MTAEASHIPFDDESQDNPPVSVTHPDHTAEYSRFRFSRRLATVVLALSGVVAGGAVVLSNAAYASGESTVQLVDEPNPTPTDSPSEIGSPTASATMTATETAGASASGTPNPSETPSSAETSPVAPSPSPKTSENTLSLTQLEARSKDAYGHRGLPSGTIDENTVASCENAIDHGIDCEGDLQKTKDGKKVVFHDALLNALSNCSGYIINKTWRQLQRCRLNKGGHIPSWTDFTAKIRRYGEKVGRKPKLLMEFKSPHLGKRAVDGTIDVARSHGFTADNIIYQSTYRQKLTWAKWHAPHIKRLLIMYQGTTAPTNLGSANGLITTYYSIMHAEQNHPGFIKRYHDRDKLLVPYLVRTAAQDRSVVAHDLDAFIPEGVAATYYDPWRTGKSTTVSSPAAAAYTPSFSAPSS